MKYIGGFTSLSGVEYTVEIISNNDATETKTITLSGTPFTTEMSGDKKTIYKPVKTQSATCTILTDEIPTDIYSAEAQGTKITLYKDSDNSVEWVGFVTPCSYDMGFDEEKEEIEIECVDALATLQYIKYSTEGQRDIKTFLQLIWSILKKCKVYTSFYISDNLQLTKNGTESIIEKLCISESNFFDKKDDASQADSDVAMKCLGILEEICQYLGYTAIAKGDSVYFIDYDAIKGNQNTFFKYDLTGTTAPGTFSQKVTLKYNRTIDGNDYAANGTKFSLDNVYNKVSVKADTYSFSKVIPDIFDGAINVTGSSDIVLQWNWNVNVYYCEIITSDTESGTNKNMIAFLARKAKNKFYAGFIKYYKNPNFKCYFYHPKYDRITPDSTSINYSDTDNLAGAIPIQCNINELNVTDSEVETFTTNWRSTAETNKNKAREMFDKWLTEKGCTNLTLNKYLMLLNPTYQHIQNSQATSYPFFETNLSDGTAFLGGENCYLVISGSYNFHWDDLYRFPLPAGAEDVDGNYSYSWKSRGENECYLLGKLQWGSYYWNGKDWQSSNCTFKLPYVADSDNRDDFKISNLAFKDNEFLNTVTWRIGTDKKGLLIPSPSNGIIGGTPKFTIYAPHDPKTWWRKHPTAFRHTSYHDKGTLYPHRCVFLKNFKFEAIISDPTFSGAKDSDTIYTNVIGANNVTELSEIKMKINTFDNKQLSYSTVSIKNGSSYAYADKLFNKACFNGEQSWNGSGGVSSNGLRSEEHLIYKIYNQYSHPATILECNLKKSKNNPIWGLYRDKTLGSGKSFIIDSISTDWKGDSENIKFIEKK